MRARDRITRIVLVVFLLVLIGFASYPLGLHVWSGYHHRAARAALAQRNFRAAGLHLERCLEVYPNDPEYRLAAAQTARRQGNFDQAAQHLRIYEQQAKGARRRVAHEQQLQRVQSGDLSSADALLASVTARPDTAEAELVLEALIEGSLRTLEVALNLERSTYGELKAVDVTKPRLVVDLWLAHRPGTADQVQGLFWRGLVHYYARDFAQSQADFRTALERDPDHLQARLFLARYLLKEAPPQAVAHLRHLRERYPEDTQVSYELASVLRGLGQLEEAATLLDETLAAKPDDVAALVERARAAMDMQQPAEAERWLRRALNLAPDDREANLTLSSCLRQAGRIEEAKQYQEHFERLTALEKQKRAEMVRLLKSTKGE